MTAWKKSAEGIVGEGSSTAGTGNEPREPGRTHPTEGLNGFRKELNDRKTNRTSKEWPKIRRQLLNGEYIPKPVKRVEIPKPGGGIRQLGIPTVVDRFIQQAIMQGLQRDWDRESPVLERLQWLQTRLIRKEIGKQ